MIICSTGVTPTALVSMALALGAMAAAVAPASAHPHHRRVAQHRPARPAPLYGYGYGYGSHGVAPMNPAYGYSESPYDASYRGPGWEVFAMQHRVEQNATLLHEVDPSAKISATGIVVGGD